MTIAASVIGEITIQKKLTTHNVCHYSIVTLLDCKYM